MRLFVDTNVFVASLTDEPGRGDAATALLNADHEFCTSMLNLMELRTVLTKKKQVEQSRVEETIDDISERVDLYVHDAGDLQAAYERQQRTLLYPMDALLLALADDIEATLATFDAELLDAGARSPDDLL